MGAATAKAGIAGNRWMAYVESGHALANMNFAFAATQVRTTASMDIVKLALNYTFGN